MVNQEAQRLGFKMKQARIVREAYERGALSQDERNTWLDELRQPRSFWERMFGF